MNKIYIGDQEINTGGGGGGSDFNPSDYVDVSTWNEHEKVIASALADLNDRVSDLESSSGTDYSEDILDVSNRVDFIGNLTLDVSSRVSDIEDSYVDASTLEEYTYSKTDIDDKIAAISSSSGPVPSGNFLQYFEVNETGFFFVDASLNIGVAIDSSGLHAPNIVEYNVINE